MILEATATIVVEPGFEGRIDGRGCLILEDRDDGKRTQQTLGEVDPVRLEIFNNLYMSIADQMGTVLRKTALSTNIRERLDFSCAIFDKHGDLVASI